MKLKTRLLAPLFAVLMLGTATSAFADLTCAVTTVPAARDVITGNWENTGDITFTCTATNATPTTDASITIFYAGLPIVNNTASPADHVIQIAPGAAYGVIIDTTRTDVGATGVNQAASLIAIDLPPQAVPANGAFTIRNVLLSLNGGVAAGSPVSANINVLSQSGNVVLTGSPIVLISGIGPMLNSTTQPPALQAPIAGEAAAPAQFTSTGAVPPATVSCSTVNCRNARASFSLTVSEDHIDSWRTQAQYYNNGIGASGTGAGNTDASGSTNVLFTFSGMLPGSIISNCVLVPPVGTTWNLTGSGIAGSAGTTTFVAELAAASGPTNLAAIETLTINCGTSIANPAYLVGGSTGAATTAITVSMSPFPAAVSNIPPAPGTVCCLVGGTPRYQPGVGAVGPVTVIQFGASAVGTTTMIIPYALAGVSTYDTGFAIANTTKDAVFGTDVQGAAPDTAGNVSFNFYPADGSASFTVTPTTGFNLVGGVVPSGNSFIGLLSAVLKAGGVTTPFQGYVIVVANFTHAHGEAFIFGTAAADRIASNVEMLIITNPLTPGLGRGAFGPLTGVEATGK